ncbi:hypothetical protein Back11_11980 [Paenibacillus baekrokdamisoli]|uniref:Uncharacterized protein n=1 Tax=Paenibacillus baekrokdamisoli TaxID=1712516 RepID=A0A3G9J512_9BACL|nr:hypothetical protein [Paenibacillus baekrokdamisoli]MBB3070503.1 hypothetical protein [Paenibacillus baekrokdamisoli]BBH19853.1 hypothetical protein Back11_11980 [Paenibacillus baekrokdamisoli]
MSVQIQINGENAAEAAKELIILASYFTGSLAPNFAPSSGEAAFKDDRIPTVEELRAKATEIVKAGHQAEVKSLMNGFTVSAIPEDQRAGFLAALENLGGCPRG